MGQQVVGDLTPELRRKAQEPAVEHMKHVLKNNVHIITLLHSFVAMAMVMKTAVVETVGDDVSSCAYIDRSCWCPLATSLARGFGLGVR